MSTKLDYLSKYGGSASTTDYLGGGGGGPKKSKKSKKSKSKKSKKSSSSRLAESSLRDEDDLRPFIPDRGDDDEDEFAGLDDGPTVVDGAAVAPSRPAAPGARRPGGSGGFTRVQSLGTGGGGARGRTTGGRERHDSSDEGEGEGNARRGTRHDSSSDEEPRSSGRRRHDSSDSSDGGGRAQNGRAGRGARHDTDSEDDAGRSDGGRRRHDSSDDGSSTNGSTRRKRARKRRDSSSEEDGGRRRPSRGRGGRNGRHDSSEEEDGRRRRRSDSDGSGKKKRRRRRDSDSGDDGRRPGRRHDSSDEDDEDDGSESVDAAGRAKRMSSGHKSGLQDAGDFAAAERRLRKKQRRELEKYNAKNGGDGRTVYRDKSGRKREVDPAADEAELARLEREREERQVRSNKGARQRELEDLEAAELAAASSMTVARGIDDRHLEALKMAEIRPDDPMAAHALKKREEESAAGTDGAPSAARPTYKGPQAKPNRYGLRPGYRWDGIERGNGFEDRVLEKLHSRGHKREEAYRWSSADM